MLELLDRIAVIAGRALAILGVTVGALTAIVWLIDKAIRRAGFGGLLLKFAMVEFDKTPRAFCARMMWGKPRSAMPDPRRHD